MSNWVLFLLGDVESHYNATWAISRKLQDIGIRVAYAGPGILQRLVEAQGYKFIAVPTDVSMAKVGRRRKWIVLRNMFRAILNLEPTDLHYRTIRENWIRDVLIEVRPSLVLVDGYVGTDAFVPLEHSIATAFLTVNMDLTHSSERPPLSAGAQLCRTWFQKLRCKLLWKMHHFSKAGKRLVGVGYVPPRRILNRYLDRSKIDSEDIDTDRYLHFGIRSIPEYILSIRELDWPHAYLSNQYFLGPAVDLARTPLDIDLRFRAHLYEIAKARNADTPIVYFSAGLLHHRYQSFETIFKGIIQAAVGEKWSVIVALPCSENPILSHQLPPNVSILRRIDQIAILKSTDLMITHGGLNSVQECASLGVPMLVIPASNVLDQPGNAARVVYHGLGRVLRYKDVTPQRIRREVNEILNDEGCRANCSAFAKRIQSSHLEEGFKALLRQMGHPQMDQLTAVSR